VRPHADDATLIQLDDLPAAALDGVRTVAFLVVTTSPGNFQAWVAVRGADGDPADLRRKVKKAAGADPSASGTVRVDGTANFKRKYEPDFPTIAIEQARLNHVSLCLFTEFPVNSYDSSQSNATSVTGVTCVEQRAAISSVLHRESAVFWVRKADTLGEDVGLYIFHPQSLTASATCNVHRQGDAPRFPRIPMKILLTEESAVYRHLLCTQLTEWQYSVEAVADAESALPIISAAAAPMVLLIDWELSGMNGLDLISAMRRLCLKHYVYAIVLTARKDKADLVTALDAGADDYLVKPFHEGELRARLQVATRTLVLHEELVNANERLECLASEDALTDLLNRRALMTAFHRERLRTQRKRSLMTLVMCDIDHFKQVNDSYGHTVGDEVLKLVARVLKDSSRGSDLVARMGGDEFLLVLPDSDAVGGVTLVQRVRKRLKKRAELHGIPVSLSFGIAEMDLEQSEQAALEKVDAALYAAKREGRDRHFVALPDDLCADAIRLARNRGDP